MLAVPFVSGALPSVAWPSKKVTLPVAELGEMVAVNVTGWHGEDGFGELESDRLVDCITTWETVLEQVGLPSEKR